MGFFWSSVYPIYQHHYVVNVNNNNDRRVTRNDRDTINNDVDCRPFEKWREKRQKRWQQKNMDFAIHSDYRKHKYLLYLRI